jgi:hypothetical protein
MIENYEMIGNWPNDVENTFFFEIFVLFWKYIKKIKSKLDGDKYKSYNN